MAYPVTRARHKYSLSQTFIQLARANDKHLTPGCERRAERTAHQMPPGAAPHQRGRRADATAAAAAATARRSAQAAATASLTAAGALRRRHGKRPSAARMPEPGGCHKQGPRQPSAGRGCGGARCRQPPHRTQLPPPLQPRPAALNCRRATSLARRPPTSLRPPVGW